MQLDALIQLALASFWMFKDAVYLGRLIFTFDFAKKNFVAQSKKYPKNDQNEPSKSNFTETQFVGILTPEEIQGRLPETNLSNLRSSFRSSVQDGYREVFRIYQYNPFNLNVWPEGAIFARDMERGFQCRTPNPGEQFLQDAFNCDKDSIASTVLQLLVIKLFMSSDI